MFNSSLYYFVLDISSENALKIFHILLFEFEILTIVTTYDMKMAIDVTNFLEVHLEDV